MSHPTGGRLARTTRTVVVRAAALAGRVGPDELASVLYRSGGTAVDPAVDPRWARFLADRAERGVAVPLEPYERSRTPHWNGWTAPGTDASAQVHKVYVSPTVACLPTVLPQVFARAVDLGVPSWKVGADPAGLHRADKIVLYLPSAQRADDVAAALARDLDPFDAQGVPFTGQVGRTAMVSRGRDRGRDSWRAAVCRAVALSLDERRAELGVDAPPVVVADAALQRVADRYDVATWHPEVRVGVPA